MNLAVYCTAPGCVYAGTSDGFAMTCPECGGRLEVEAREDRPTVASDCPAFPCDSCNHRNACPLAEGRKPLLRKERS